MASPLDELKQRGNGVDEVPFFPVSKGTSINGAKFCVVPDDTKLYFGNDGDTSIEYDEDGDDVLQIAGAQWNFTRTYSATSNFQLVAGEQRGAGVAVHPRERVQQQDLDQHEHHRLPDVDRGWIADVGTMNLLGERTELCT